MIKTPRDGAPPRHEDEPSAAAPYGCDVSFVDEHALVAVRGELDLATGPELLRELQATLVLPLTAVTIDLAKLSFMDSSGIHVLLVARTSAEERGIAFSLTGISSQGRRVLEVAGLAEHFGLDD
jgi:anti-sigma B factor antagonist